MSIVGHFVYRGWFGTACALGLCRIGAVFLRFPVLNIFMNGISAEAKDSITDWPFSQYAVRSFRRRLKHGGYNIRDMATFRGTTLCHISCRHTIYGFSIFAVYSPLYGLYAPCFYTTQIWLQWTICWCWHLVSQNHNFTIVTCSYLGLLVT